MTEEAGDDLENEYLDLSDDSELAFAQPYRRKYKELESTWASQQDSDGWHYERRFVEVMIAFDDVHGLGFLTSFRDLPTIDRDFGEYFQEFRRHAAIAAEKVFIEAARRAKASGNSVVVLDASARQAIHRLIEEIREKLNTIELKDERREALFDKLNAFAAEIDRNRTRTERMSAFVVEPCRTAGKAHAELKPIFETVDRIFEWIEKAKKWKDALPPWEERKKIELPRKSLPPQAGKGGDLDDDIPF